MERLARLILALFALAILLAVLRDGPAGAGRWLRAKFLGRLS